MLLEPETQICAPSAQLFSAQVVRFRLRFGQFDRNCPASSIQGGKATTFWKREHMTTKCRRHVGESLGGQANNVGTVFARVCGYFGVFVAERRATGTTLCSSLGPGRQLRRPFLDNRRSALTRPPVNILRASHTLCVCLLSKFWHCLPRHEPEIVKRGRQAGRQGRPRRLDDPSFTALATTHPVVRRYHSGPPRAAGASPFGIPHLKLCKFERCLPNSDQAAAFSC